MKTNRINILILLLLLGFIWGSGYSLARYATTHGVNPLGYSFWQSLGPAILLLLFTRFMRVKLPCSFPYLIFYFICGLLGIAIPNTNMYLTSPHLPAGILAVVVNTVPIFIYILAFIARHERFSFVRFLGVISGILGILCLIIPQSHLQLGSEAYWILLALFTPLCFACYAIFVASYPLSDQHPLALATGMLMFSALQLVAPVFITQQFYVFNWPLHLADKAVLLEIVLSSIGYIILFQLLKMAGAVYYSLVGGIVAITGLFWGWLFFAERLTIWISLSVLLILIALTLVTITQTQYWQALFKED